MVLVIVTSLNSKDKSREALWSLIFISWKINWKHLFPHVFTLIGSSTLEIKHSEFFRLYFAKKRSKKFKHLDKCWYGYAIIYEENQSPLWQKSEKWILDVLFDFWPPCLWRLSTELHKFVWKIWTNNSSTGHWLALRIGQLVSLLMFY